MATLYRTDGTILNVAPVGKRFTLDEVLAILGGYAEAHHFQVGRKKLIALCNEDGWQKRLPINTTFHSECMPWALVGDVLVVSKGEF